MIKTIASILLDALALLTLVVTLPAHAQQFPVRPITLIVPFGPGPVIETAVRQAATEASRPLGQPVVIENRPGANGRLGINAMKNAPPDGYTLALATEVSLVLQPLSDAAYKMEIGKDYQPIAYVTDFPILFAINPALPFRDIKGLIAYAKANPGKLNFSYGIGSASHSTAELFREQAGIDVTFVPYKDSAQGLLDLAAGRVDLTFTGAYAKPFVDKGAIIGVATTGKQRWSTFPTLPTFEESGVRVLSRAWFLVIAHPATPAGTLAALRNGFSTALKSPTVTKHLSGAGMSTGSYESPEEIRALVRSEEQYWGPVIRKAGIKF